MLNNLQKLKTHGVSQMPCWDEEGEVVKLEDVEQRLKNATVVVYFNICHWMINTDRISARVQGIKILDLPKPEPKRMTAVGADPFSPRKRRRQGIL